MRPIYTLDRQTTPHIDAAEYILDRELSHIFAVPERGAIGTNSLNNAITVLDLSAGRVKWREVRRNFKKYVSGGDMVFLPEFSRDTIGYSQTRGFLLFNVKTGEFRHQLVVRLLELTVRDVAVLDWDKRLFLFNVEFLRGEDEAVTELHVIDLSGSEPKDVARFDIEQEPRLAALGRTTFYFGREGDRLRLHALDTSLKPVMHPLLSVYNSRNGFQYTGVPSVHPDLPIAIFAAKDGAPAGKLVVWAAGWREGGKKPVLYKLLESLSGDFRYSPDGKWVLFTDDTFAPNAFMAMPVDPSLPHFFGPPILLRTDEEMPARWNGNCAWISDPVSVVCNIQKTVTSKLAGNESQESVLLKWELSPANVRK